MFYEEGPVSSLVESLEKQLEPVEPAPTKRQCRVSRALTWRGIAWKPWRDAMRESQAVSIRGAERCLFVNLLTEVLRRDEGWRAMVSQPGGGVDGLAASCDVGAWERAGDVPRRRVAGVAW